MKPRCMASPTWNAARKGLLSSADAALVTLSRAGEGRQGVKRLAICCTPSSDIAQEKLIAEEQRFGFCPNCREVTACS